MKCSEVFVYNFTVFYYHFSSVTIKNLELGSNNKGENQSALIVYSTRHPQNKMKIRRRSRRVEYLSSHKIRFWAVTAMFEANLPDYVIVFKYNPGLYQLENCVIEFIEAIFYNDPCKN